MNQFNSIPEIIEDIKKGKIVIMLDDYDRENEGDFVMASELVTPEAVNFMALYGRGLICTPINTKLANQLDLMPMVASNTATHETAFTVTIDAKEGISTGISAKDRAYTIKLMMDNHSIPKDFSRPGHIFPLIAKDGGVLKRRGHTEAAVDLAVLAGLKPSGVICEILREDGEQARGPELFEVAKRFGLKIGTIEDLANYLNEKNNLINNSKNIHLVSEINFPNKFGEFKLSLFVSENEKGDKVEHLAVHTGLLNSLEDLHTGPVLVRVHSECFTGDVFGSLRCDCGPQLEKSLEEIAKTGKGIVIYLKQEGRGIGLLEKIKAYSLQEKGLDTVEANEILGHPADSRDYNAASKILEFFNIKSINLLTNNPLKIEHFQKNGFQVTRVPLLIEANVHNKNYQKTKVEKMGHLTH